MTPKIKAIIGASSDNESTNWTKCPTCEKLIYNAELEENYLICSNCSHHFQLPCKARFDLIFDDKQYEEIHIVGVKDDPLKFKDTKKYIDRLKETRQKTSHQEAIAISVGTIGKIPAVALLELRVVSLLLGIRPKVLLIHRSSPDPL